MSELPVPSLPSLPAEIVDQFDTVTNLVQVASDRSLDWFRRPLEVGDKSAPTELFDPVTEADRAVEDEIRAGLAELFPTHQILGEERGTSGGDGAFRWVIDPIDGTRAFISGQPMWGTLLGLVQVGGGGSADRVVAGWLHQPTMAETYIATHGESWLISRGGRRQLATSATTDINQAIVLCTHPSMFETEFEQAAFARVVEAARMVRYSGDCINYALVASGDADLVVENQMQPYDVIPLIPLIENAGGVITGLDGQPPLEGGWVIAAANQPLHTQALSLLNP